MKISSLGRYQGYSGRVADGYVRSSQYVAVPDGCRIAVDVLRPCKGGVPLEGPLPTVLLATGYRRSFHKAAVSFQTPSRLKLIGHLPVGSLVTKYEEHAQARELIDHGYVVVVADLRGTGASFGQYSLTVWRDAQDMAEITQWIAAQSFSDGKIGMIGGSWEGVMQIATASLERSRVTAIMPSVPAIGLFDILRPNGAYAKRFLDLWADLRKNQDTLETAPPVDEDVDGALLHQAQAERTRAADGNASDELLPPGLDGFTSDGWARLTASVSPELADPATGEVGSPLERVGDLNLRGTAVYLTTGWWDMFIPWTCIDLFCSIDGPAKRLTIGPWHHGQSYSMNECLRWFDCWLKGIDNGVLAEPPVAFATMDARHDVVWRTSETWPPRGGTVTGLHPTRGEDGAGRLTAKTDGPPSESAATDPAVGLGPDHRLSGFMTKLHLNPVLLPAEDLALAYTTDPFETACDIVGAPEARLLVTTSAAEAGVLVVLEEVLRDGVRHYVTEGVLNLRHRKVSAPSWIHVGGAHHSVRSEDEEPIAPGAPMEAAVELAPVAWRISAGSRLRMTVLGGDPGNFTWPGCEVPQVLTLGLGASSRLDLPLFSPSNPETPVAADAFAEETAVVAFTPAHA